ncbi:MAG: glycosyltransferase family 4 protein [Candidatus Levybacteria bacterium]|nr:glycosyltransferase family 4 protein [Candidatus Levybacteria bacterium]
MGKLRIAFLAPLKRPINSATTVSRNRIIVDLAIGLVKKRHHATIFGTADSNLPGVEFIPVISKGLNFLDLSENPFYTETAYITHAIRTLVKKQSEFDLIHNHMYPEFLPLLAASSLDIPLVTTIHAQITPELKMALADTYSGSSLVCISKKAQELLGLPSVVIYNGIDTDFFVPKDSAKRDYFLFVGRLRKAKDKDGKFLDPKGVQNAILACKKTGEKLKIVGNVEEKAFYDRFVAPHLSSKIEFIGQASKEQMFSREEMRSLYQGARALPFPINWEEPFGLVMIEAMACGTPVIAFNRGSVPEIVRDGLTGYVIDYSSGVDGLVEAVKKINLLSEEDYQRMRKDCRERVEENFSIEKMVEVYEKLYYKILRKE